MNKNGLWKIVAAIEVAIAIYVIVMDLFIPTIVILGIIVISLLIRRENISVLGFKRERRALRMAAMIFLLVIVWQLIQLSLIMPILNHLTGVTQDLSTFEKLKGNVSLLLTLLALTWTLAAFGEEIVYRGYLQKRIGDLFGSNRTGLLLAVGISSILFGIAHTEQGFSGVIITTLDALFFSWLKHKYGNNLWASILAHGFSNTIGMVAFFFIGPVYGFW